MKTKGNYFKNRSETISSLLKELLTIVVGSAIGAYAIVAIMIPNGLTSGGITGMSRILQETAGATYSSVYYIMSFAVLIIVLITLGVKEARKIIAMSVMYPTMIFIFERLDLVLLESKDMILSAIFCGVAFGLSNGIIFSQGYSSGGTDSIAKVFKRKLFPYIGMSRLLFGIDLCIIICSAFIFGTNIALYAMITMYVTMKMSDAVLYGIASKIVELSIITTASKELTEYVMHDIGRGVTSEEITGEYTKEKRKQLKILCSPRESFLIKRFLAKSDPRSFVSVIQVNSVWGIGKGFRDIEDPDVN